MYQASKIPVVAQSHKLKPFQLQNKPKNIHMELGRVFTVKNMIKTGHTSTVNGKWNWAHHNISAVCFPVVVVNIALCHE